MSELTSKLLSSMSTRFSNSCVRYCSTYLSRWEGLEDRTAHSGIDHDTCIESEQDREPGDWYDQRSLAISTSDRTFEKRNVLKRVTTGITSGTTWTHLPSPRSD